MGAGGRAAVVALALACGCGSRQVPGSTAGAAGDSWWHVASERIRLQTNVDGSAAAARFAELERLRDALDRTYQLVAPGHPAPTQAMNVVHFADCDDMRDTLGAGPRVGGMVVDSGLSDEKLVITCEWGRFRALTFVHELAHVYNGHYFPVLPIWLNEGLASYFETLQVAGGKAVLGAPSPIHGSWVNEWRQPELSALRAADGERFYSGGAKHGYAWKLVHLLMSDEYYGRFRRYLFKLAEGVRDDEAWHFGFGDVSEKRIAEQYWSYHLRRRLRLWTTSYRWTQPPAQQPRRMRPADAHLLRAELLLARRGDAERLQAAYQQVQLAAAAEPGYPPVLRWRALIHLRARHWKAAVELLRRYTRAAPEDPQGWYSLVTARMSELIPAEHTGLEEEAPPGLEALEPDVHELVTAAGSPAALNQVAWYYAMLRRPQTGLNFAMRALEQDPSSAHTWDTLALLRHQLGQHAEALAAQERAVAILGERRPSDGMKLRLARYRELSGGGAGPR